MNSYSIQTCSKCGSYLIPQIRYQYGIAWTEYYCTLCEQKQPIQQIIYSTTTDFYPTEKKHSCKSRLIKDDEYE